MPLDTIVRILDELISVVLNLLANFVYGVWYFACEVAGAMLGLYR